MSECVCARARVCFFLKDLGTQFSDFFLNVSYVCFASQRGAESLKPHPMYTHTYTPCIKSVSVKSRRVLVLPPLDLQNQGKGGGGAGGQRGPLMVGVHLCISFYNENYLNSTLARKSEGFLKNKVFFFLENCQQVSVLNSTLALLRLPIIKPNHYAATITMLKMYSR